MADCPFNVGDRVKWHGGQEETVIVIRISASNSHNPTHAWELRTDKRGFDCMCFFTKVASANPLHQGVLEYIRKELS